jgi:hypothetical protein
MKLFISWSGEPSQKVAELLRAWIPNVIQEADVWVSSQDIGKGERWSASLWQRLAEIDFGLIAVTQANIAAPWVQFEAGALSKTVRSRVIPILCDLSSLDAASSPLAQFQYAKVTEDDFWHVSASMNTACERPLDESRLRASFGKWWPDLLLAFQQIEVGSPDSGTKVDKSKDAQRLTKIENALDLLLDSVSKMRRELVSANMSQVANKDSLSDYLKPSNRAAAASTILESLYLDRNENKATDLLQRELLKAKFQLSQSSDEPRSDGSS